jgi:anti-anti-sigma factor
MQDLSILPPFVRQVSRAEVQPVETGPESSGSIPKSSGMNQGSKEIFMLNTTVQKFGDTTVLRCEGRIVVGDAHAILRRAVLSQTCTKKLVLDLAQVNRIDAGGLGVLLDLRQWAYSHAIRLRLMNVMNQVEQVLQLTQLDRVFEFCSVRDMFCLLHHPEAAMAPRSVEPANQRTLKNTSSCSARRPDSPPVDESDILLPAATAGAQALATVPAEVRRSP